MWFKVKFLPFISRRFSHILLRAYFFSYHKLNVRSDHQVMMFISWNCVGRGGEFFEKSRKILRTIQHGSVTSTGWLVMEKKNKADRKSQWKCRRAMKERTFTPDALGFPARPRPCRPLLRWRAVIIAYHPTLIVAPCECQPPPPPPPCVRATTATTATTRAAEATTGRAWLPMTC